MCHKLWLRYALLILAVVVPAQGLAKSDDAEQPIHVTADSAELNEATGIGVYRGDVRITQGSMVLTADEVTLIAPGRDLRKVIAQSDEKSTFRQLTDAGREITAEARRMEYEPEANRIILLEDAILHQAANRFASGRIVYHIDRQVVDAGGKDSGRVEMTLIPRDADARPADAP